MIPEILVVKSIRDFLINERGYIVWVDSKFTTEIHDLEPTHQIRIGGRIPDILAKRITDLIKVGLRLQYPYAGDFYIGEMEMRRRNAKLFGRRVKNKILRFFIQNFSLTAFYKYFSLYGENYWLPLVWIFLTIILFGYVLSLMGIPNPWGASAFTFFQMPPKYVETLFEFSFWLSMAVLLERLAGVLFTALFVLALRRKFKKTEE